MANILQIGICCIATGVFGIQVLLECFEERWKISVGMNHDGVSSVQGEWVRGFSRISMAHKAWHLTSRIMWCVFLALRVSIFWSLSVEEVGMERELRT